MGIRQKRTAETKALLFEAGLSVFAERGIEFATLDVIELEIPHGSPSGWLIHAFLLEAGPVVGRGPSFGGAVRGCSEERPMSRNHTSLMGLRGIEIPVGISIAVPRHSHCLLRFSRVS